MLLKGKTQIGRADIAPVSKRVLLNKSGNPRKARVVFYLRLNDNNPKQSASS